MLIKEVRKEKVEYIKIWDMKKLTKEESKILEAFNQAIVYELKDTNFFFGNYKDNAICLTKNNNYYEVCFGFDKYRHYILVYNNLMEACLKALELSLISRVEDDEIKSTAKRALTRKPNHEN